AIRQTTRQSSAGGSARCFRRLRAAVQHERTTGPRPIMSDNGARKSNNGARKGEWNGHQWVEPNGRPLNVARGESAIQYHCVRCAREFLSMQSAVDWLAVFASAVSFYRLRDEVTKRWLAERCPGKRLALDDEDRKQRVSEITLSAA